MGGEGSMASSILSLKQNRGLLKKRNVRELKDLLREKSGRTELEFKKVDSKELARIKEEIRRDAKINIQKEMAIYLISFVLSGVTLFYLIHLIL